MECLNFLAAGRKKEGPFIIINLRTEIDQYQEEVLSLELERRVCWAMCRMSNNRGKLTLES